MVVGAVKMRPRARLGRVVDDLGATLLELVHGDADRPDDISGIVIYDPVDEPALPEHALVLGVGLHTVEQITAVLAELGAHGAVGLVLRAPVPSGQALRRAADDAGVAVLALTRGASWTQLAALLRSLLAEGDVGDAEAETLGGVAAGDLFALANAIAALLDAPVTIEDRGTRVLAFSGRQDEADASRVETILGRRVPERLSRMLADQGVFRELYRSDRPVYVEPLIDDPDEYILPRVAVAVRAGDEVLGSIWAAVREPLSAERSRALCDGAKLVALHMLRIRAGADVERRLRADLIGTALEGGPGASDALNRLGLADQPVAVLALTLAEPDDRRSIGTDAVRAAERQRLTDAFAMHLSAVHPQSAAALVGDVGYGLVPVARPGEEGEERALRIATGFLDRIGDRGRALIGTGPVAENVTELAHARLCADRALRVLHQSTGTRRVARLADVTAEALLVELRDLVAARGDRPSGPVARLLEYDARHNSHLLATLRAWLDAFGDVIAASAAVHVHPNTFRYRLQRLAEVGGIDLTDSDARFAAMLQLRVLHPPDRGR